MAPDAGPAAGPDAVPRLLLVADGFVSGRPDLDADEVADRAVDLVEAGVPWVSFRDVGADDALFSDAADRLAARLRQRRPATRLSVHGRLDVARRLGAGLHAGRRGATVAEAVAAGVWPVGVSAHSAAEAVRAAREGAHYVTVSPVFHTRTHPAASPLAIDGLRRCAERAGVPVLALGGMTPPRARACRLAGAHGAAAIASLLLAVDPDATVAAFLQAVADP